MDPNKPSISSHDLYAQPGSDAAPIAVDVRRDADVAAGAALVADAFHRSPDAAEQWRTGLPNSRQVVTYCVAGREVSQGPSTDILSYDQFGAIHQPWIRNACPETKNDILRPERMARPCQFHSG